MNSNAFNYFALLAALVIGYGVLVSSDPETGPVDVRGILQGIYLHDAVITETNMSGAPQFRVAAVEVTQNLQDNSIGLRSLRVDYLNPPMEQPSDDIRAAHWVLNADRGTATENFRKLALEGNVQAHNLGAPRTIVMDAPTLDVDMDSETIKSRDPVRIGIDASTVTGRGFFADLKREQFVLESNVGLKLAQIERKPNDNSDIQVPESFEAKSSAYDGAILTMTEVASTSPPFIKARQLKASGLDIANNKIELRGDVSVELPKSGSLLADMAIVTLRDRAVAHAHVTSQAPEKYVEFQHRAKDTGKVVQGHASAIDYDVERSTLHLEGNVWFKDERGEWTMDQLDYNIATEAWRGTNTKASLNRPPKESNTPAESP